MPARRWRTPSWQCPPDLSAARAALSDLRRATRRLERNLDIYKEATKAAFNEFVDFAVLAVTTIVTLGEGSAVILAIRATAATIGTKLVLKGDEYSVDEFLMDLRSGLGTAAGGKLLEGAFKPIAAKIAGYASSSGLSRTFGGKVLSQLGKAADWEVSNLVNTASVNVATGQDLTTGMGATGHARNLAIHGVTSAAKAGRGGRATSETESVAGPPGEEVVRPAEEATASPRTEEGTASPRTDETAGATGLGRPSERQGSLDAPDPVGRRPRRREGDDRGRRGRPGVRPARVDGAGRAGPVHHWLGGSCRSCPEHRPHAGPHRRCRAGAGGEAAAAMTHRSRSISARNAPEPRAT